MHVCRQDALEWLKPLLSTADPCTALRDLFIQLDDRINNTVSDLSGCCLTVIVVNQHTGSYTCANVGDVEAIHTTPTSYWVVTTSHRLQHNSNERMRLGANVDRVSRASGSVGPPRLYPGGLACSRSVGDKDAPCKSCVPDISSGTLHRDDAIIVATDGLWDHCSHRKMYERAMGECDPARLVQDTPSTDDLTIAVVYGSSIPARRSRLHRILSSFGSGTSLSSFASSPTTSGDEDEVGPPSIGSMRACDGRTRANDAGDGGADPQRSRIVANAVPPTKMFVHLSSPEYGSQNSHR